MFFYEGMTCPVCKKPFGKDEDVVACPQCGLPHHRECWHKIGHCHQEDKHGTDEQWSRSKAYADQDSVRYTADGAVNENICPNCHTRNMEYAEFCNHCGTPLETAEWHSEPTPPPVREYTPFQSAYPVGEIYTDAERMGSATARDMAAVVGQNTVYYMPRFRRMAAGGSGGWNWSAFILGPYWLIYRKQYLSGIILLVIQLLYSIASSVFYQPYLDLPATASDAEVQAAIEKIVTNGFFIPLFLFSFVILVLYVLLGLKANALYMRFCEKKISKARTLTPDLSASELAAAGGTSVVAATLCYFIPQAIVSLVTAILGLL